MGRSVLRAITAALAAALLGASVPPAGAMVSRSIDHLIRPDVSVLQGIEHLRRVGIPEPLLSELSELTERQSETYEGSFFISESAGRLDADDQDDVFAVAIDYTISFGDDPTSLVGAGYSFEASTKILAVSGVDGKVVWQRKYDDFVFPIRFDLDSKRSGALIIHGLVSLVGPLTQRTLELDMLDGSTGKSIWTHSHDSTSAENEVVFAGHEVPLWFDIFDGIGDRSDDVILAFGDVAAGYLGYVVKSDTVIIDGSTGELQEHPTSDLGINWVPGPWAVSDLNDDGKDDYVVALSPAANADEGLGAPVVGDQLVARSGTDGSEIWSRDGLDFADTAWVFRLPDVDSDGVDDFAVSTPRSSTSWKWDTYLISAKEGEVVWERGGLWPFSPGDINRDGNSDVILRDAETRFGRGELNYVQWAYSGRGKLLWKRRIESHFEPGSCRGGCSASAGIGFWEIGDLQPDGLTDSFVYQEIDQRPGEDRTFTFTVDGRTGRRLLSGGEQLRPLGVAVEGKGTDLVDVEVHKHSVEVGARQGTDGSILWRSTFEHELRDANRSVWPFGAHLNHDPCGDVVLLLHNDKGGLLVAFSGRDGGVMWSRPIGDGSAMIERHITFDPGSNDSSTDAGYC